MAFEQTLRTVGLPAASDLTSGGTVNPQFYFVTVNSSGQINFTGAGAVADGVVQDKPNAQGVEGEVAILGFQYSAHFRFSDRCLKQRDDQLAGGINRQCDGVLPTRDEGDIGGDDHHPLHGECNASAADKIVDKRFVKIGVE